MRWRDLRAFLNMKFNDDDSISLVSNYDSTKVIVLKNPISICNNSILFVDGSEIPSYDVEFDQNEVTPPIFTDVPNKVLEYSENEISTYFGGFNKRK